MPTVGRHVSRQAVVLDVLGVAENHRLNDALDVLVGPDAQEDPLRSAAPLGPQVRPAVDGGSQHVVHPVGVEHEGGVRDVVLAGGLRQREPLLQHAEDGLGHGFGAPGFQGTPLAEAHVVHQVLVGVPALLPHRLQLVLVAVC